MTTLARPTRRFLVLATCCASIVVVVMDISIVYVALPAIRHDLHASVSGLQWTIDAYTLVLASFLVLAGSAADRFGRRRVFQLGLVAFGLGSLLCGLAPGIGWLIAARTLQAAGGTMLNPVAMAIIVNTFPEPAERARAIGVFGSVSGLSLALGPILGGALVDSFGWYAVFWINVPVVAAALVSTALFVPESRAARARRFDPVGQILVFLALACAVFAIIEAGRLGWTSPAVLTLLAVAVLGVLGILGYERRRADPLLELRLFRSVPVQRGDPDGAVRLVRVRRVPVRDHAVPAERAWALAAGSGVVPAPGRGDDRRALPRHRQGGRARAGPGCRLSSPGPRWRWVVPRHSGSRRPPRCPPCSGPTCCSASSWARSTHRSPTRRWRACRAR